MYEPVQGVVGNGGERGGGAMKEKKTNRIRICLYTYSIFSYRF
jgi:hypothetical protein